MEPFGANEAPISLALAAAGGKLMAKDGNTYAKKARETLKRQKAQEKRERRQKRKEPSEAGNSIPADPRPIEA
jgi:hypothetical protein